MTRKIRVQALLAAHSLQPRNGRYGLASAFRKYYDVSELSKQERRTLANSAMNCLSEHNQVGWRMYAWFGFLEIAALKEPKPEQLKAFEQVMSGIKPTSTAQLAILAAHYYDC